MPRLTRILLALSLVAPAVSILGAGRAEAAPPERDDKPWGRGVFTVGGGLGGAFYGGGGGALRFGVGAEYYVWHGLGLGLGFSNEFLFLPPSLKRDFPGLEDRVPTYFGTLMPTLRFFLFRSYRFSPYVLAGTGPVFLNNRQPTLGQWQAGGGAFVGLGPNVALDIGVGVNQLYTQGACERALSARFTAAETGRPEDTLVSVGTCGIGVFPRIGLVFGFGGSREDPADRDKRRERKRRERAGESTPGWEAPEAAPAEPEVSPGELPPAFAPTPETDERSKDPGPYPIEGPGGDRQGTDEDRGLTPGSEPDPADDFPGENGTPSSGPDPELGGGDPPLDAPSPPA